MVGDKTGITWPPTLFMADCYFSYENITSIKWLKRLIRIRKHTAQYFYGECLSSDAFINFFVIWLS
ncbi:hypothetical protein HZS_6809 [Henneguya salminicola]|nr:hypothetical protein HZS_6809 [Henneguya salminicola]